MKSKHRTLACATALIALIGLFAVQPVDLGAQEEECPLCVTGEVQGETGHQFMHVAGEKFYCTPGSYDCHYYQVFGACAEYHYWCPGPHQDAVDALSTALTVESPALLQKALGDYPDILVLDPASRSVEMLNCDGEVTGRAVVPEWATVAVLPGKDLT